MADSFAINLERVIQTQEQFSTTLFINRAFAICSRDKDTFENCYVKYLKGWTLFNEAYDEVNLKYQKKYNLLRHMEDRQIFLKGAQFPQ